MPPPFRLDPFVSIPPLTHAQDYPAWSTQMRAFLTSKDLWSLIEDSSHPDDRILWRAPPHDLERYHAQTRQRRLVGTYLKAKLAPSLHALVSHAAADGPEIWSALQRHFRPPPDHDDDDDDERSFAARFHLDARLAACRGEAFASTHDFAQAYGELRRRKDAAGVGAPPEEEEAVIGFLVGLECLFPDWVAIQVRQISASGGSNSLPSLEDLAFEARVWEDLQDSRRKVRPWERNCAPTTGLERARGNRRVGAGEGNKGASGGWGMDLS